MEVGAVIGRFQVETLHEGHRFLINEAFRHHKKVIIFIGCPAISGTKYNPLDFPTRERMLRAEYPDALILPQYDCLSDEDWSRNLDRQIRGMVPNLTGAKLYGGRDSFKGHYKGEFTAVEVESGIEYRSGSKQREDIGKVVRGSPDFRAGIIYGKQNDFPYVKMCVDIACFKLVDPHATEGRGYELLLGRKSSENKWRLPGGGVSKGENLETAACREFAEETSLAVEIGHLKYLGSFPVNDHRYKTAGEIGLLTGLFMVQYTWGGAQAADDLFELKWVKLEDAEKQVIKAHKPLVEAVRKSLK